MTTHKKKTSEESQDVLSQRQSDPSAHERQVEPAAYQLSAEWELERDALERFVAALNRARALVHIAVEQDMDAEKAAKFWPKVGLDPTRLGAAPKEHGFFPPGKVSVDSTRCTGWCESKITMRHDMRFCFPAALDADQEQALKNMVTQILCSAGLFESISFEPVSYGKKYP